MFFADVFFTQVQDLERQLYDAKLDAMNAQQDHSDHGSESGSETESEVPNLSSLKEAPTEAEKSQINDLKAANERIDQLEVEVSIVARVHIYNRLGGNMPFSHI